MHPCAHAPMCQCTHAPNLNGSLNINIYDPCIHVNGPILPFTGRLMLKVESPTEAIDHISRARRTDQWHSQWKRLANKALQVIAI